MGGLLLTPRPSQAQTPGAAPTTASTAGPSSARPPGDLSPRANNKDETAADPASPSPEQAVLGLPREVSLAELFPAEAAMGAAAPDAAAPAGDTPSGQDGGETDSGDGSGSRLPLFAGMVVTLGILFGGGGLLWWRNRDTAYWPA